MSTHTLDISVNILSASGLPLRVTESGNDSCFIQLTALNDPLPRNEEELIESNVAQEIVEQTSRSPLLQKQDIHHVGLKCRFTINVADLYSIQTLNDILHNEKHLIRLEVVKADENTQSTPITPESILASTHLDLSQLLHGNNFEREMTIVNNPQDLGGKGKKPAPKGKAPIIEDTPLPTHTTISYSIQLHNLESIVPPKEKINFVSFSVGPVRSLPQSWIQQFLDSSSTEEKKMEGLKNHLFTYTVDVTIPCVINGTLNELSFALKDGTLQREHDDSWDTLFIAFKNSISFYLNSETIKHFENMVFNKEGFSVSFRRELNPMVVKDSTWEDHNCKKYTANIALLDGSANGLAIFLDPGKTSHTFTKMKLSPILPPPETSQDDKKKGAKDKVAKLPKDLPSELAPEPELKDDELHPYEVAITSIDVQVFFSQPIIPLAQDRLGSSMKLEDLIPKREPIPKRIAAIDTFKAQVAKITSQLSEQYENLGKGNQSSRMNMNSRDRFIFELNNSGTFFAIKELLKKTVVSIVEEKFASQKNSDPKQRQHFYNNVYIYLMEHVHEVLNKLYSGEQSADSYIMQASSEIPEKQVEDLKRLALESEFEEDFTLAAEYFQKRVDLLPNSVEMWHEYARFNMRIRDEGKAEFCYRQALGLNIAHIESLLDYAILLIHQEKYNQSQVLLNALISIDEQVVNVWVILSLLYECMDLNEDSHNALNHAKQILTSRNGSFTSMDIFYDLIHYILYTLQVDTVAELLLQRLQTEAKDSNITNVLYGKMFLLRQDFDRAELKLKQALEKQNNNIDAWMLLGDVHSELNHKQEAKQSYEISISIASEGQISDPHIYMKLGRLNLDLKNAEGAKAMYLRASELWYCSLSLLGLGIAFYQCGQYDLAEQALNEANILDNRNVNVWGWLTLVNVRQNQLANAAQCKLQMDRLSRPLKDLHLQRIFSQVKGFQDPDSCVRALQEISSSL